MDDIFTGYLLCSEEALAVASVIRGGSSIFVRQWQQQLRPTVEAASILFGGGSGGGIFVWRLMTTFSLVSDGYEL